MCRRNRSTCRPGGFRRGAHDPLRHPAAPRRDEALLAHIVQVAFAQRRKTLRNNLKGVLDDDGFTALDIDPGIRRKTCRWAVLSPSPTI